MTLSKTLVCLVIVCGWLFVASLAQAEDMHDHAKRESHEPHTHESSAHDSHVHHRGEHHDEEQTFGPDQGIQAVRDHGQSFRLHPKAIETLAIRTAPVQGHDGRYHIPVAALVTAQLDTGVYQVHDRWFTWVPVQVEQTDATTAIVRGSLTASHPLAMRALGFLRAAHLEASGQGGRGHAH